MADPILEDHINKNRQIILWTFLGTILLLNSFLWGSTRLQAQDLYAVTGIDVDEMAESEVAAKEAGIARAKHAAFLTVMDRLTLLPGAPKDLPESSRPAHETSAPAANMIPVPQGERLEFLIRDVSFQNEKFGGGRYLAEMTVRFQPDAINRYLQRRGIAYLSAPSARMVILPIYRQGQENLLWSDVNPWLDAWWRLEEETLIVPFELPLGDLADLSAIDAQRALVIDPKGINAIAERYSAGAVAIPIVAPGPDGSLLIEIATFGAGWPGTPELLSLPRNILVDAVMILQPDKKTLLSEISPPLTPTDPATPTDPTIRADPPDLTEADILHAAAMLTLEALEDRWKRENILRFDQGTTSLKTRVALSDLSDWLSVQAKLDLIAPVQEWRLTELTTVYAIIDIEYVGNAEKLHQAFARHSLRLAPPQEQEETVWQLHQ